MSRAREKDRPQQQRVSHLTEMIEEGPHPDDEFKSLARFACFFEKVDGHLADLGRGIVELRNEELQSPLVNLVR